MEIDKHSRLTDVNCIELPCDYAVNGDLIVVEGNTVIPFDIARVFLFALLQVRYADYMPTRSVPSS